MSITLVLLPGMDGTGELFGPFIDALGPAQPVQVLRYPTDRPWGYTELLPWAAQQLPTDLDIKFVPLSALEGDNVASFAPTRPAFVKIKLKLFRTHHHSQGNLRLYIGH